MGRRQPHRNDRDALELAFGLYNRTFSWFTMPMPVILLLICLYLAFGKFGKIKLGGADDEPEMSTFAWIGTLFTAGIGIGIVNFGVAEPLVHYLQSPVGIAGGVSPAQAAEYGMKYSMFIWGLPAWAIYTMAGLVIGYFAYYKGKKFLPGEPIAAGFSDKAWAPSVAVLANIVAAGAAALTIAAHIAIGIFQIQNAVHSVSGFDISSATSSIALLIIMFFIYTFAAILPIQKGMGIPWQNQHHCRGDFDDLCLHDYQLDDDYAAGDRKHPPRLFRRFSSRLHHLPVF